MRSGRELRAFPRAFEPRDAQVRHREPAQAGLRLRAPARRALVADLAARARGGARKRRDGGRVVVRLHLHRANASGRRDSRSGRWSGSAKNRSTVPPSITAALSEYATDGALRVRRVGRRGSCRRASASWGSPSMTHDALKILWRQCSEFACANIVSSTSVGLRPSAGKYVDQVVDFVRRQRQAERAVGLVDGRAAAAEHVDRGQRLGRVRDGTARRPSSSDWQHRFGHAVVQQRQHRARGRRPRRRR